MFEKFTVIAESKPTGFFNRWEHSEVRAAALLGATVELRSTTQKWIPIILPSWDSDVRYRAISRI